MAEIKPITAKAGSEAANEALAIKPALDPNSALLAINVFDGTRQPIKNETQLLLTVTDGAQNQLYRDNFNGPSVTLKLPFHNNFVDNYSIVVSADHYGQAGFQPIRINPSAVQELDLMLLSRDSTFHFAKAKWTDLLAKRPLISKVFAASLTGEPGAAYEQIMEDHPDHLACLLNISTAMQQIFLGQGPPMDYFKEFDLHALGPDRIFGYADAKLVDQVRQAAHEGKFMIQPAIDLALHGDAMSSFKQIQFGEANVQLTFYEKRRKNIDGTDCVYVEPDIDYYKDLGAHLILEVIPNHLAGIVSDPRIVYVLRWIAGRHAGQPEFDPLYTIE